MTEPAIESLCSPVAAAIDAIEASKAVLLVGHVHPDVDAAGSMLALARAVPGGRAAAVLPGGELNHKVRFLLELAGDVRLADAAWIAACDVAVVLDTAGVQRVGIEGGWEALAGRTIINIDHHVTNSGFGHINWVDSSAGSVSELVDRLIRAAGWVLDRRCASLLYAGMYADTAAFSLPGARAESFDTAARLIRCGADPGLIGERLLRSHRAEEFNLLRAVYRNTRLTEDGLIAYSVLSHEDIAAAGCSPADIDGQVSVPRSLSGIRMAVLFSEGEPGVVRINLRGENGTSVLGVAEHFGGGGHPHSAGIRIRGPLDEVVDRVMARARGCLAGS